MRKQKNDVMRKVSILKVSCILLIFVFAISSFSLVATVSAVSESEATLASNDADETVALAYTTTLKAEEAGADVSDLLTRLDEAGGFLAHAHMAHRSGDFDDAVHFAKLAKSTGEEVQNAANSLEVLARGESQHLLLFTLIGSVAGVVLIVLGSFLGWRVFKRRYYRKVLKMKPEVASSES
jgi:hypothetical protein